MSKKKYNNALSSDLAMLAGRTHQAINRVNVIGDMEVTTKTAMKMQEMTKKVEELDAMISELFTYTKQKGGK